MTDDGRDLSPRELEQLATLHRATMPTSVLGRMNASTLERYYRWVSRSDTEHLFVTREGDVVAAAAVLSVDPESVVRRFVQSAPLVLAWSVVSAFARNAAFRHEVRAFVLTREESGPDMPEVLQIFVRPDWQGRHAGTRLLDRVERWLKGQRLARYCVRTLAAGNDAALTFYRRRGFNTIGERRFCGARFLVLQKTVA